VKTRLAGVTLVAAVCAAVMAAALAARPNGPPPEAAVGHPAPDFGLNDVEGHHVSLQALRGKVVLLNFFATWCVPCRSEMADIGRLLRNHPTELAVLAIDKQEPGDDVRAYTSQDHLPYAPLLDPTLSVWQRYHVNLQPVSFWIDRAGTVRAIHYGPMAPAYMARTLRRVESA
jgi:peroxiredoxin